MEIIKRGAEGDLYGVVWNSRKCVVKVRRPKSYRHPLLDRRIRRQRTIREAQMLHRVKSFGVCTPTVFLVDARRYSITMQYMHGVPAHGLRGGRFVDAAATMGRMAGTLHANGVMHGDMTTSNFIVSDKISIIDFGLSIPTRKPEDHAVDLRLYKEILNSAHVDEMQEAWQEFLSGYGLVVGERALKRTIGLVSVIEGRGRYARVV